MKTIDVKSIAIMHSQASWGEAIKPPPPLLRQSSLATFLDLHTWNYVYLTFAQGWPHHNSTFLHRGARLVIDLLATNNH